MLAVQLNNYPTNIPVDMWDITNPNASASWPFAYITLLSLRLHSFTTVTKAESIHYLYRFADDFILYCEVSIH
jgi:hypothetical protein